LPVLNFIKPYIELYPYLIFSIPEFVPRDIFWKNISIFTPTIDPLNEKNRKMPLQTALNIINRFGLNVHKPLLVQVSRFDIWKDPLGVIDAYRLAKKKIPDLQLAYCGLLLANDDPEAKMIYKKVKKYAKDDPHIFAFIQLRGVNVSNDLFVNAFQTAADVIIQKSTKEGFGLVVTEAMWKGKPVIGGDVGGIKYQIQNSKNGFLVNSPVEAAKRIVELIKNKRKRIKMGKAARRTVRRKFLLPRLIDDYLKLFTKIMRKK